MTITPESNPKYRIFIAGVLAISIHSLLFSPSLGRRSLRVLPDLGEARYLHETDSTLPPWAHFNLKSVHSMPDETETPIFWHIPKVSSRSLALDVVFIMYLSTNLI